MPKELHQWYDGNCNYILQAEFDELPAGRNNPITDGVGMSIALAYYQSMADPEGNRCVKVRKEFVKERM